jgi:50S ribosomal protein L16 3-hydroxylase
MYKLNFGDITIEQFLAEYWQKKPLFIKGAFTNFVDPISPDELAGLAMEEEIESRIIAQKNKQWLVEHGPFESYDQFGEDYWSLLVQATNNWSEPTQQLLEPFKFIPNWRIDDVMVSYSTPQGGVGAHLDQYDVFIIQGQGKRRWQVGLPDDSLKDLLPHPDLKQVSDFSPLIDVETEAGDLLYIPPNHPHNGYALTEAMNFSVGFQAPNSQDLWSCFADLLIDNEQGLQRFTDAGRKICTQPERLTTADVSALKTFMLNNINDEQWQHLFARFVTQSHHELEILAPVEPLTIENIEQFLEHNDIELKPVLGIKAVLTEQSEHLFINGDKFELSEDSIEFGQLLAINKTISLDSIKTLFANLKNKQLLTSVLNKGYWYLD